MWAYGSGFRPCDQKSGVTTCPAVCGSTVSADNGAGMESLFWAFDSGRISVLNSPPHPTPGFASASCFYPLFVNQRNCLKAPWPVVCLD